MRVYIFSYKNILLKYTNKKGDLIRYNSHRTVYHRDGATFSCDVQSKYPFIPSHLPQAVKGDLAKCSHGIPWAKFNFIISLVFRLHKIETLLHSSY